MQGVFLRSNCRLKCEKKRPGDRRGAGLNGSAAACTKRRRPGYDTLGRSSHRVNAAIVPSGVVADAGDTRSRNLGHSTASLDGALGNRHHARHRAAAIAVHCDTDHNSLG